MHTQEISGCRLLILRSEQIFHVFAVTSSFDGCVRLHRVTFPVSTNSDPAIVAESAFTSTESSPISFSSPDSGQPRKKRWTSLLKYKRNHSKQRSSPDSVVTKKSPASQHTSRQNFGYQLRLFGEHNVSESSEPWENGKPSCNSILVLIACCVW